MAAFVATVIFITILSLLSKLIKTAFLEKEIFKEVKERRRPVTTVKTQGLQDLRYNILNPAVRQSIASNKHLKFGFELIFRKQLSSFAPFKSSRHNCKFVLQIVSEM